MSEYHDASLILQIYDLRREARMRDARAFFLGPFRAKDGSELNQVCPPGTEENAYFRQVLSYWDMVSAIVKRHVMDKELFFETNGEITIVWEKVKHLVPEMRTAFGNPLFLANLEEVAGEREAWLEARAPGYLASLRERIHA